MQAAIITTGKHQYLKYNNNNQEEQRIQATQYLLSQYSLKEAKECLFKSSK